MAQNTDLHVRRRADPEILPSELSLMAKITTLHVAPRAGPRIVPRPEELGPVFTDHRFSVVR